MSAQRLPASHTWDSGPDPAVRRQVEPSGGGDRHLPQPTSNIRLTQPPGQARVEEGAPPRKRLWAGWTGTPREST